MTFDSILDLFFPKKCILCGKLSDDDAEICPDCAKRIVRIDEPHCVVCGLPSNCCRCEDFDTAYDRRRAPFVYSGPIKSAIHRMKFSNKSHVAKHLGRIMAEYVSREYNEFRIDAVVCVPMRRIDIAKRGYNQASLLADAVAAHLGLEHRRDAIVKIRRTKKQHKLNIIERAFNVKDAFFVPRKAGMAGMTVLLCDDVVTTGHTLNECAKALLDAGTKHVLCIAAAAVCSPRNQSLI